MPKQVTVHVCDCCGRYFERCAAERVKRTICTACRVEMFMNGQGDDVDYLGLYPTNTDSFFEDEDARRAVRPKLEDRKESWIYPLTNS